MFDNKNLKQKDLEIEKNLPNKKKSAFTFMKKID